MHHPRRRNVTTSMVGFINGHICKNLTQNGEPQRYSWGTQKKKKKVLHRQTLFLIFWFLVPSKKYTDKEQQYFRRAWNSRKHCTRILPLFTGNTARRFLEALALCVLHSCKQQCGHTNSNTELCTLCPATEFWSADIQSCRSMPTDSATAEVLYKEMNYRPCVPRGLVIVMSKSHSVRHICTCSASTESE